MADSERFRDFWERQAATYDAMIRPVEARFLRGTRRWVAERATGAILEVAIGTGLNLPYYPPEATLTGIEWSPAMVAIARRRAAELGLAVDLSVGDAMQLPFPDASFDTVVSTYAMCCIPDEVAALRESARVLKPGGSLLLADHVVSTAWPIRTIQRLLDRITVPGQGEHWTRRPYDLLPGLGLDVVASRRRTFGAVETVHAVRRP